MNINFYMPTRAIMAEECIHKSSELIKIYGKKAIIVTGVSSAKSCGALQDVTDVLSNMEIQYCIYDKIKSNPTISSAYEGAEYAKANQADFVIGIGGGSPMDAAKAIALLAAQDIKEEDLFSSKYENLALPIILIPTTAGTGSEVTPYAILTNDKKMTKTSLSTPLLFPKLALLDAKYTKDLPLTVTINTALDAMSHAIEGMLTVRSSDISDNIALESIKQIAMCLKTITYGKNHSSASHLAFAIREKLLYASMMAGIVIAHTGTTAVHSMGYNLTYFKNIDHGRANALLLPSFLRFVSKSDPVIVKKILFTMGMESMDEFEALFLGLLDGSENITEKELERYATIAIQAKNIKNSRIVPNKEDIIKIYTRSLQIKY